MRYKIKLRNGDYLYTDDDVFQMMGGYSNTAHSYIKVVDNTGDECLIMLSGIDYVKKCKE